MSSLRNAVKRKTHKERSQPEARKKFGLLEKHKDYVLRAKDFNKKRDRIQALRLKAALRNPDEFYFGMNSVKTREGVHVLDNAPKLDHDTAQLMKTQDLAYVNMKRAMDTKKSERLRANLHRLDEAPSNKHTIFLDSKKEVKNFDVASHFGTAPELSGRAFNRPRVETLESGVVTGAKNRRELRKVLKQKDSAYKELTQREERTRKMTVAAAHLDVQRAVMNSGGTKRKIKDAEGDKPAVYQWKRERKR